MSNYKNILITGHNGFVGKSLVNKFKKEGYNVITADRYTIDLLKFDSINNFLKYNDIDCIIHSAAKVGGIQFNINNPATMGYENSTINLNILEAAHRADIKKVIFLGSSCIYPKECPQPMKEEYLLTGPFEPTNEMYGLAKTLGVKMVDAYNKQYSHNWFSVQPCNIYGPNDNFDPVNSHFMSANIRKIHEAKISNSTEITCWGSGKSKREILYVEDLADAIHFLLNNYNESGLINIGMGEDKTIKELIEKIAEILNYTGIIKWDLSKPDGMPRKLLDISKLNKIGWKYSTDIDTGILKTYEWYKGTLK